MSEFASPRVEMSDEQWKAFADGWQKHAFEYLKALKADGRPWRAIDAWLMLALTELGKLQKSTDGEPRGEANPPPSGSRT